MENKELLQAMRDMMKEEMTANNASLRQEMGQMMDEKLEPIKGQINTIESQMSIMQEDISEIKEDTAITRSATNSLVKWADDVSVLTQIKFPVKEAK